MLRGAPTAEREERRPLNIMLLSHVRFNTLSREQVPILNKRLTTTTNTTSATCVSDPPLTGTAPFGGNSPPDARAGGWVGARAAGGRERRNPRETGFPQLLGRFRFCH